MTRYSYKGRNTQGAAVTGTMEAETSSDVALRLTKAGVVPITIDQERRRPFPKIPQFGQKRVQPEELIFFTRQLGTLTRAGISLTEALGMLGTETQSESLQTTIDAIRRDVEGGANLSDALSQYPRIFSDIYVHTIRAAETGGFLDHAFTRLATMLDNALDTRRKIKAAIRYPAFVLTALAIGVSIIVIFVIPRFAILYGAFNAELPLPTRLVLAFSTAVHAVWPLVVAGIVAMVLAVRWWLNTPWGRRIWDDWKLQMPIVGPLVLKFVCARLGHTLGILTSSGVPLVQALDITARAIGNTRAARELEGARRAVEGGSSLAEPLSLSPVFPPLLADLVAVGEKTGSLDNLLSAIAEHYDTEANYTIKNLPTIIEPLLLVGISFLIFMLALAVFLPMWDMAKLIRR